MHTFLNSIASGVVALGLTASSLLGINHQAPNQNLGAFNVTAGGTYRLASSVGTTDTSIKLSSFKEPISNTPYTMAYMNTSVAYGTLDPQQPTRSELISFTGITQNSDGTAILTGVTRGLQRSYPYTASATFRVAHPGQSIFILSDAPQVFNQYTSAGNNNTITGIWSFPEPTTASSAVTLHYATTTFVDFASNQTITGNKTLSGTTTLSGPNTITGATTISNGLTSTWNGLVSFLGGLTSASTTFTGAPDFGGNKIVNLGTPTANTDGATKAYVDGVTTAGAPISNNTTTGIARTASSTQISSGYSSTTPYFIPSSLASSTASTSPVVVVTNSNGKIDPSFVSGTESYTFNGTTTFSTSSSVINASGANLFKFGGNGSDGALDVSSGTTTIDCASASICNKNYTYISITGTGVVNFSNPATTGTIIILKSVGNVTLTSSKTPMLTAAGFGGAGGASCSARNTTCTGGAGTAGISLSFIKPSTGGAGGVFGSPPGNTNGGSAISLAPTDFSKLFSTSTYIGLQKYQHLFTGSGGGGGAVGEFANTETLTSGTGGNGGGALIIECGGSWNFTTTNGISVAGLNGSNANTVITSNVWGTGGGAGGGGGFFQAIYNKISSNIGSINISGGIGGSGGKQNLAGNQNSNGGGGGGSYNAGTTITSTDTGGTGGAGYSLIAPNTEF